MSRLSNRLRKLEIGSGKGLPIPVIVKVIVGSDGCPKRQALAVDCEKQSIKLTD